MDRKFFSILSVAIIFSFMGVIKGNEAWQNRVLEPKFSALQLSWRVVAAFVFLFICVGYISSSGFNPFIYFRF